MSVQERLTNGNGFRILTSNFEDDNYYLTYEDNIPNSTSQENKLPINAIYFPTDATLVELGYWEELFFLNSEGERVSDGFYYRNYMVEWAGGDVYGSGTQVLGGNLSHLFAQGQKILAGTWLYAPQGHPFDVIGISKNENKEYVILY